MDSREQIHGPLWRCTLDALHGLEGMVQFVGTFSQGVSDRIVFSAIKVVRLRPRSWGIDHHLNKTLADHRSTERDGDKFVDLLLDGWVESYELEETSAVTTF